MCMMQNDPKLDCWMGRVSRRGRQNPCDRSVVGNIVFSRKGRQKEHERKSKDTFRETRRHWTLTKLFGHLTRWKQQRERRGPGTINPSPSKHWPPPPSPLWLDMTKQEGEKKEEVEIQGPWTTLPLLILTPNTFNLLDECNWGRGRGQGLGIVNHSPSQLGHHQLVFEREEQPLKLHLCLLSSWSKYKMEEKKS